MGVQGLWELLAPVGRRVSVETLAGKRLAIDASIWMVQFMKAMRDEKGDMVRNAHLLGFFRRICKLLYLRTKPVFVFDGGTPALKRRTVIARRRQRENAQAKIRKTAEKLLLNHLKAMRLKELAEDLQNQKQTKKNDLKGKKRLSDQAGMVGSNSEKDNVASRTCHQEKLDEMLAASMAAEEDGSLTNNASTSGARHPFEEDDDDEDEDEEMILPALHGTVDPAVLAALPPSMQLDLLVQMREGLMAENRQKYQKVKKAPEKFSELQIQAYLKTVAFRREIDQVQKAAAGKGVGGVQTSRIASEANREFIFSSSFTGDKEALASARAGRNGDNPQQTQSKHSSSDSMNVTSSSNSSVVAGLVHDESGRVFDDNVETYRDERGRVRVSRLRAMGIRMTRDLQRNLDLMKEIEHETASANKIASAETVLNRNANELPENFAGRNQLAQTSVGDNDESTKLNGTPEQSMLNNETSIEISFEADEEKKVFNDEDALFAQLVSGDPVTITDSTLLRNQTSDSASDCDWEEGIVEVKDYSFSDDVKVDNMPSPRGGEFGDDDEEECKEFPDDMDNSSLCPDGLGKTVSKGYLEEKACLQEAIRRSLLDLKGENANHISSEHERLERSGEIGRECFDIRDKEDNKGESSMLRLTCMQHNKSFLTSGDIAEELDNPSEVNILHTIDSPWRQLVSVEAHNPHKNEMLINKMCESIPGFSSEQIMQDVGEMVNLPEEVQFAEAVAPLQMEENAAQTWDINEGGGFSTPVKNSFKDSSHISGAVTCNMPEAVLSVAPKVDSEAEPAMLIDDKEYDFVAQPSTLVGGKRNSAEANVSDLVNGEKYDLEAEASRCSIGITHPSCPPLELSQKPTENINVKQKLPAERIDDKQYYAPEYSTDKRAMKENNDVQYKDTNSSLEEEMLILGQECMNLGDEQRKLERNAESVSSEMFAECQELLQMFGLPYIIAPMEAEAQCAYLELANLVDGVVTDDSDVFLFGARSVYKNIFDDRKYVETYFMKDIEKELGLMRKKLIRMALLLGSDYTEGISGIGIVNATEVVNAFPEEDGLHKFREWVESPDPAILGKLHVQTGTAARKRGSKFSDNDVSCSKRDMEGVYASDQNICVANENKQSADNVQDVKLTFMDKHRNVSKNWHIPTSFPSEAVMSAYSCPQVDKSTEPFSWGKPDHFVLRKLCWEKFGWPSQKSDELLLPVLKEYNKHETQLRLEAFYSFNERFAKIRSKRIKKAVAGIAGNQALELMDDTEQVPKARKKRRISQGESGFSKSEKLFKETEEIVGGQQNNAVEHSATKKSRKRTTSGRPMLFEIENSKVPMQVKGKQSTSTGSHGSRRGRGRGRGQVVRRRRGKGLGLESSETSSSDGNSDDEEDQGEKSRGSEGLRRSKRPRKPANYTVNELESDDAGDPLNASDKKGSNEKEMDKDVLSWDEGDAAAGFNKAELHEMGDPAGENFSGDYLEKGGGVCIDEGEITQPRIHPSLVVVGEFAEDYLKMGGGFCIEESETEKDQNAAGLTTILEDNGSSRFSSFVDGHELNQDHQKAKSDDGYSKEGVSLQENTDNGTGTTVTGALKAMPFLRRKRRKS